MMSAFTLGLSEKWWKTQRCRKNASDGLRMCITCKHVHCKCDGNSCELWFADARCSVAKVGIISL